MPSRNAGTRASEAGKRGACCRGTQGARGDACWGTRDACCRSLGPCCKRGKGQALPHPHRRPRTRGLRVGSGQARHGGRGEEACMPPRRSGRVLWRGHAGTRACGKASLSTSQKSLCAARYRSNFGVGNESPSAAAGVASAPPTTLLDAAIAKPAAAAVVESAVASAAAAAAAAAAADATAAYLGCCLSRSVSSSSF